MIPRGTVLVIGDGAINLAPDLGAKARILQNAMGHRAPRAVPRNAGGEPAGRRGPNTAAVVRRDEDSALSTKD